ncbi:MAG: hypothetical protein ACRDJE_05150 [Dehalococcoidia bacterium]
MATPAKKRYVQELTYEEAWELLEDQSHRRLGVGLREFIAKWFAGDYGDDPDDNPDALELAVLLPGVGVDPWRYDKGM